MPTQVCLKAFLMPHVSLSNTLSFLGRACNRSLKTQLLFVRGKESPASFTRVVLLCVQEVYLWGGFHNMGKWHLRGAGATAQTSLAFIRREHELLAKMHCIFS